MKILVDNNVPEGLLQAIKAAPPMPVVYCEDHTTDESSALHSVLLDVAKERQRQDAKFGIPDLPSFFQVADMHTGQIVGPVPLPQRFTYYGIPTEEDAKTDCQNADSRGKSNYGHILVEEVSEAFGAATEEELEKELIQVAAVTVKWI